MVCSPWGRTVWGPGFPAERAVVLFSSILCVLLPLTCFPSLLQRLLSEDIRTRLTNQTGQSQMER